MPTTQLPATVVPSVDLVLPVTSADVAPTVLSSTTIPPPPPLPPLSKADSASAAPPLQTSSPVPCELVDYSIISDAVDLNTDQSKLNIVASDHTINASSVLASTVVTPNCDDVENVIDTDKDLPENDPNLVKQEVSEVAPPVVPYFIENTQKLPALSVTKRVSLAYKYYSFPRRVPAPSNPVSEARGSDDEADPANDNPEIVENSFPLSSFILESWQSQGKRFKNSLQEALVMHKTVIEPDSNTDNQGAPTVTVDATKTDEFTLHSENYGSILKGKPTKKQGDFFFHEEKFAPFVQLDSNVSTIQKPGNIGKKWKMVAHLSEEEVKNIQTSMSYGLYAESHATAYCRATRKAINQVLVTMNPETESSNIQRLQDAKQLLRGVANAIEQSVGMFVYVHAGLTAQLRANFLQAQGNYLPTHVKQNLLHQMFGGSALFNSSIAQYAEDIEKHNSKFHQKTLNTAVVKSLADQSSKFVIPKVQNSDNSQYHNTRGAGRGGGGGRGSGNRGRGGNHNNAQTNKHDQVKDSQNTFSRGGHRGGKNRGGRGKKN